jgi:hypothetical protein
MPVKKKKMSKKTQHGGQKKKLKMCMCQKGGMLLSPAQLKMITRKVSTLPVKRKQMGMGHGCMCKQYGGDFLGIGSALKRTFSNPLRGLAAVSSLGLSETFLQPAEAIGKKVGVKPSDALKKATPILGQLGAIAGAPQLGQASGLTAEALKQMGLGSRRQPILV